MMLITYCKFLYLGICMCLVTTGYHGIDNLVTTGYHCIDNLVKQRCCLCLNLYYIFKFTLSILKAEIKQCAVCMVSVTTCLESGTFSISLEEKLKVLIFLGKF